MVRSFAWVDNHRKLYSLYWLGIEGCRPIVPGRQGNWRKTTVCSDLALSACLDFKQVELSSHDKYQDLFQTLLQPSRYNVDKFDQRMIDRDEKITGSKFRQKVSLVMKSEQTHENKQWSLIVIKNIKVQLLQGLDLTWCWWYVVLRVLTFWN